ncbi:DUF1971 domain-containing protein [Paracoccus sp. P2]|uniref:DUF1971 domain-containing protein n=1 Tax=Paracoccus pantotrophus TaxID=82367 RepID=A0A1I5IN81_PARPN|nr:DUF1971 domain-containing protein [Paracoccus pantotrophus]MDF3855150.1 DUF1971 domain-containing protein [Paracoccus pantotrophus]QFG35229.1 DUF1971 domain-containing protein [Paracoccus pantotrophus]QLH13470.1 DUF1971 domain-containing protein [Paracoccus pantotrophus]RKS44577.1 tellurite resistance-related uncharacterized protein [Paracoccus pantotrophus]RNI16968.1 DUF1971 domain-containing protein [Paracoccus pantotrophus]
MSRPAWPGDAAPYRRTPEFTETTVPKGLLRAHATRPGTWARLHVLEGRLVFRDLVGGTEMLLGPGIHPLIHPERLHEVAAAGPVRFFVEFCARPGDCPAPT